MEKNNIETLVCTYNGCSDKAISVICASKQREETIYKPSCLQHEPETRHEIEKQYVPLGYTITILDIPSGSQ